jgi:hypothetical protein
MIVTNQRNRDLVEDAMAKTRSTVRPAKSARRKSVPAAPKGRKAAAAKSSAGTSTKRKTEKKPSPAKSPLGRPKVTGEEALYMLFKDDYHARQFFDFLRVQTVRELEQYSPQQIVKLLSKPITDTVNRIRSKLAEKNRFLSNDADFAVAFQQQAAE